MRGWETERRPPPLHRALEPARCGGKAYLWDRRDGLWRWLQGWGREGRVELSARVSEWGELKRLTAESAEAHRVKVMADFGMKWLVFQGRDLSAGCC